MSSEKDTIEINFINLNKEQIIEQLTPKNLNQWENADIILIINDKEYNSSVKANTNVAISFEIRGKGVYLIINLILYSKKIKLKIIRNWWVY